jgi:hypothetical protein
VYRGTARCYHYITANQPTGQVLVAWGGFEARGRHRERSVCRDSEKTSLVPTPHTKRPFMIRTQQRRWQRVFGCVIIIAVALVGIAGPAFGRDRVFDVQLDRDMPKERAVIQRSECRVYPSGCSRLVVRDGKRQAVLTPFTQRPRYSYGWRVKTVRFPDLTGDGRPEILWSLQTAGATVSSPSLRGVDQWNGRHASRIFKFTTGRKPPAGYIAVVFVKSKVLAGPGGSPPEIETRELLLKRGDSNCCPSAQRVIRHRWNGKRIAPVPGSTRIELI